MRSLRLPLLLSLVVHAALAAAVAVELPVVPRLQVMIASLHPVAPARALMPVAAPAPVPAGRPLPTRQPMTQAALPIPAASHAAAAPAHSASGSAAQAAADAPPQATAGAALDTVQAALELPRYDAAYLANPPPAYPLSARRRGIEGTVLLEALVDPAGEARDIRLVASAGDAMLDEAAREAVRHWRFVPARRGAEPVEAWVRIPVVYRLN